MIPQRFISEELSKIMKNSDTARAEEKIEALETFKLIKNMINTCLANIHIDGEDKTRKFLEKSLGNIWLGPKKEHFESLLEELEEIKKFASLTLLAALTDKPRILATTTFKERKIVVTDFGGGEIQAFYCSKGKSGAEKDKFHPFDGVGPKFQVGGQIRDHLEKTRFMPNDQFQHDGNKHIARIANILGSLQEEFPPETPCSTGRDLNNLISKNPNHPAQIAQREYEEIEDKLKALNKKALWQQIDKTTGPERLLQNIRTRMAAFISSATQSLHLIQTIQNEAAIRKEVPFEDAIHHLDAIEKTKKKIVGEIRESLDVAFSMG